MFTVSSLLLIERRIHVVGAQDVACLKIGKRKTMILTELTCKPRKINIIRFQILIVEHYNTILQSTNWLLMTIPKRK